MVVGQVVLLLAVLLPTVLLQAPAAGPWVACRRRWHVPLCRGHPARWCTTTRPSSSRSRQSPDHGCLGASGNYGEYEI